MEMAEDYSAAAFLHTFRRFCARREKPIIMYSDNAGNFTLGPKVIQELWQRAIIEETAQEGVQWQFITPRAPWRGGAWERLIGVTKYALKRSIGKARPNVEEYSTLLCEVESIVNSRPITFQSEKNMDKVLRPIDFLFPFQNVEIQLPNLSDDPLDPNYAPDEKANKKEQNAAADGIEMEGAGAKRFMAEDVPKMAEDNEGSSGHRREEEHKSKEMMEEDEKADEEEEDSDIEQQGEEDVDEIMGNFNAERLQEEEKEKQRKLEEAAAIPNEALTRAMKKARNNENIASNSHNKVGGISHIGSSSFSVLASDRLMKEFKALFKSEGFKNGEPEVDYECKEKEVIRIAHVYCNPEGLYYDAMLNLTNIQKNKNEFFLIQLLESTAGRQYWGRIFLWQMGNNLQGALKNFHNHFQEKTGNKFLESRKKFEKINGKYDLIRIDYSRKVVTEEKMEKKGDENGESSSANGQAGPSISTMDERIKRLMHTLCDLRTMGAETRQLDCNSIGIPLGKITKEQIKAGCEALTRIDQFIREGRFGQPLNEAVNAYYTRIPHSSGIESPPRISSTEMVNHEIDLLKKIAGDPLDAHYSLLKWELMPVERSDEKFRLIEECLLNTQNDANPTVPYRLELRNIFELNARDENDPTKAKRFREDLANRKLLWHGTRQTNLYGILTQGLRIAPPAALVTGYTFGKGVYFSDSSTPPGHYSNPDGIDGACIYMLLCEVALGEILDVYKPDDAMHSKLENQKYSVRGSGGVFVDTGEAKMIYGIKVPSGKLIEASDNAATLIYNEFIVFNLEQIRERFLVEVKYIKIARPPIDRKIEKKKNDSSEECCRLI